MKKFIEFIVYFIIIISPIIFIFHLFISMLTYEYSALIDNENIETMKEYLLMNNIEVKDNLKKVKIKCVDWDEEEFSLIYEDNEIQNYIITENDNSELLTEYIIKCSGKNDMLGLRFALIGISIIASIVTLCRLNRTEIIYED